MSQKPQWLERKVVARTKMFTIEQISLRFSNGEERVFERVNSNGREAVLVVPMLDDDTVLLIKEYAVGTDRYELGLPKGLLEIDEKPLAAANRELQEEVGMGAHRLELIKSLSIAPGYFSPIIYVVLAEQLYLQRLTGDEPEPIEVVPWRMDKLDQLLEIQEFSEARSIAALLMVKQLIKKRAN